MNRPWLGEAVRVLIILVVAALPRLIFLDADPPTDIQAHFVPDEGLYSHNARLHALFGEWIMDEHNVGLFTAPLHTAAVRASYQVFGTGLWQTRLPGALAGIVMCLMVYGFLRRESTRAAAFAAALLLATSGFLHAYSRVAHTEVLQTMWIVLAFFAALRARHAIPWAAVSAVALIAAMFTKPSSIASIGTVLLLVGVLFIRDKASRPRWLRATGVFTAAGLATMAVIGLALFAPNWAAISAELEQMARTAADSDPPLPALQKFLFYGFRMEADSVRVPGSWLVRDAVLVIATGLVAFGRFTRLDRRAVSPLEIGCWIWVLLTLIASATHPALPPDRRYVLLIPPLTVLLSIAAFGRGDGAPPDDRALPPWRTALAWLVAIIVGGVYLRIILLPVLRSLTSGVRFGEEAGFSSYTLLAVLWVLSAAMAAVLVARRRQWFGWLAGPRWAIALFTIALVISGTRVAVETLAPRFEIRDASRAIGRMAAELPPERRAIVGVTSITMAMETDLFAFVIRDWPFAGVAMNLDGLERYTPGLAVFTTLRGKNVGGPEGFEPPPAKEVRVFDFHRRPGEPEGLRTVVHILP